MTALSKKDYQKAYRKMVHLSAKAVNSNAQPGGVRLDESCFIDLPYVSISTGCPEAIPTDFIKNNQSRAEKHILAVAHAINPDCLSTLSKDTIDNLKDMIQHDSVGKTYADLTEGIDCRLKQVLMPVISENSENKTTDICITPLHSTGFAYCIQKKITALNQSISQSKAQDKQQNRRRIRQAVMCYGGKNPVNIGCLASSLSRPLFFAGPMRRAEIQKAYAYHFRGVPLPYDKIDAFLDWSDKHIAQTQGKPNNLKTRETIAHFLKVITETYLKQGEAAYRYLCEKKDVFKDGVLDKNMPFVKQGVMDKSKRDTAWADAFSKMLAHEIIYRVRFKAGYQDPVHTVFDEQDNVYFQACIERVLLDNLFKKASKVSGAE